MGLNFLRSLAQYGAVDYKDRLGFGGGVGVGGGILHATAAWATWLPSGLSNIVISKLPNEVTPLFLFLIYYLTNPPFLHDN